ncbi:hypothetical protein BKA93DRAFT_746165 [Sparassis latifolia]
MTDPEDLLSDSLQTLYDYTPVVRSSAGREFVYSCPESQWCRFSSPGDPLQSRTAPLSTITLRTPDTQPANWPLHVSSIWISSLYIADHLDDLHLDHHIASAALQGQSLRLLEFGAGAGLPGILTARCYPEVRVVLSDYPDEVLIRTLVDNVGRNGVVDRCSVVAYAWGSDPSSLFSSHGSVEISGFDVIVAADTLWNPELHSRFIKSLHLTLKKSPSARVYLVAGLHTGCYAIDAFLRLAVDSGLDVEEAVEREVNGNLSRPWCLEVAETHDEQERRRWVVWIVLKWKRV